MKVILFLCFVGVSQVVAEDGKEIYIHQSDPVDEIIVVPLDDARPTVILGRLEPDAGRVYCNPGEFCFGVGGNLSEVNSSSITGYSRAILLMSLLIVFSLNSRLL
nr:uncharacterized protein LOC106678387 [Halyomorpha halys]